MSLKAKIEAVIYASEEPVTLNQLVGLLADEGYAELDALAAQQPSLPLETPEDAASDHQPETAAQPETTTADMAETLSTQAVAAVTGDAGAGDDETIEANGATPDDAVAKRQSRERERQLRAHFRSLLDTLIADYANGDRGLEVREIAGGFRLATKPEYHDAVRGFVKSLKPPLKLTLQALETLAVIAYKQPVTAPEISDIRGVDSGGVIGSLITRKLVATGGRKQVIGRPILYKTTKDFLLRFGLKDISELPSIEEFEKMASELNEAIQEEIPMEESAMENANGSTHSSGSVDEINAAPEPANASHDDVEGMLADKSSKPEGARTEHSDPKDVEPMTDQHEPQADGDSTEPDTSEEDSIEIETSGGSKTGGA